MFAIPSRAVPEKFEGTAPTNFDPASAPRSVSECMSYQPWWRSLVVTHYFARHRAGEANRKAWSIPASEDDWLVKQYFAFRAYGSAKDAELTKALRWCHNMHYVASPVAGKLRAMLVAGMNDDEIAPHFATTAANISLYCALFFDIRQCLHLKMWMESFLRPPPGVTAANDQESAELLWMSVAYRMGRGPMFHVMSGTIACLQEDERREFWEKTRSMINGNAFLHVVDMTVSHQNGRAVDLERSLQMIEAESRATNGGGGSRTPLGGGGTDVSDWLREAGDERRIFDPGMWFAIKNGVSAEPPRPTIEMVEQPGGTFVPEDHGPELGDREMKRRMSLMFGGKSCK